MENRLTEVDDAIIYAVPSKEKVTEAVERLYSSCEDGIQNPLDVLTKLKFAEKIISETTSKIMPLAIYEASKHEKGFMFNNFELNVQESGTKYDYSNCGHPEYDALKRTQESINEKLKEIEAILKANKTNWEFVDTDTGETFTIHPPKKTSTTTVGCKLK